MPDHLAVDRNGGLERAPSPDPSPFSETIATMPSYLARGLLYLVVVFLGAALLYSAVTHIDMVVSAPASVVPEGRSRAVQPAIDGSITRLLVQEGDEVREGQPLAALESRDVSTYLASLETAHADLTDIRGELRDVLPLREKQLARQLQALESKMALLTQTEKALRRKLAEEEAVFALSKETFVLEGQKHDELVKRLRLELANAEGTLELWKKELDAHTRLRSTKAVSEAQYLVTQRSHAEAGGIVQKVRSQIREADSEALLIKKKAEAAQKQHERAVGDLNDQLDQTALSVEALRHELDQKRDEGRLLRLDLERRQRMAEFRHRQARLLAGLSLRGVEDGTVEGVARGDTPATNQTVITAPIAGRVCQVLVHGRGESVARGQTIMTLVPAEGVPTTEIRVANKDIGLVRVGQPVRFKFDAFPFADHGAIDGEVTRVLPDAEVGDRKAGESHYRVLASLGQSHFRVQGRKVELLSGMTATAEIITERKTPLALLLKPFAELGKPGAAER